MSGDTTQKAPGYREHREKLDFFAYLRTKKDPSPTTAGGDPSARDQSRPAKPAVKPRHSP